MLTEENVIDEIYFLPEGFIKVGVRPPSVLSTLDTVLSELSQLGLAVDRTWRQSNVSWYFFLVAHRGPTGGQYLTFKLETGNGHLQT